MDIGRTAVRQDGDFDVTAALRRCARGDRTALRDLFEAEAPRMLGVALRIVRDRATAEDVVQDAFVRIWRSAAGFDPTRGAGRAWVHALVRNLALNVVRDAARTDTVDDPATLADAAAVEGGEDVLARLADGDALRRCLERLDAPRRHALVLAYVHGFTHGEIAGRLGAPLGTCKAWIRRGLASLRECLA
jgi:RNA polymerase sigma-70 factor (ECF subfamily)